MKKQFLLLFVMLISCLGFSQSISWKGITWDVQYGTATVDGSGNLVLTADASGQAWVHVNQIASLAGASTPWIQLSYMDVTTAGHKIDMLMEDEAGLYPRFACGSMWTGGEIFALRRQASPTYETYLMFEDTRQNIERTVYIGKRATGTLDVNFDGKKRSSTYLNQIVGGSWGYKDVYLRLRGAAPGATATFTNITYGTNHANQNLTEFLVTKDDQNVVMSLKKAVDESAAGDVVNVLSGTYAEGAIINVDKVISIIGATTPTRPVIQTAGTVELFDVSAGATIKNLEITKTDLTTQDIIRVRASNILIDNCKVHGQYVIGENTYSRAMVVNAGGFSGIQISNNEFYSLRQPAYISGTSTGSITNNLTYGTRGWVVEGGNLSFTGNTWGSGAQANVFDIAIIPSCPAAYYTDIVAMSAANNNAVIEDQRGTALLSVVYVDKNSTYPQELGSLLAPYKSITPAIARVVSSGTIYVASGTYNEDVTINKSVTLQGADKTTTIIKGLKTGTANTLFIGANNATIDGFTITRDGNNTTDWNTTVKSQGIIFGQSLTGCTVRNCIVTGNRNGIYLNNTQGHSIHDNLITDNRTGIQLVGNVSNCLFQNNTITNNWTLGIVIYYASTGQPASTNVKVNNNNISGNWYGQVNSKTSLANPTTSYDFSCNWYGTSSPKVTSLPSNEPSYAAQIPVEFGGTATSPATNSGDISGDLVANISYIPYKVSANGDCIGGLTVHNLTHPADYSTIQAAIDAATTLNGDVINVDAGTYNEAVIVNKSVTLKGANAGVLAKDRTGSETIIDPNNTTAHGFKIVTDNVTIDGFTITNSAAYPVSERYGVVTIEKIGGGNFNNINVLNNHIQKQFKAINFNGTDNFTIKGNWMQGENNSYNYGCTWIDDYGTSCNTGLIDNNDLEGYSSAIEIQGDLTHPVSNVTISNNRSTGGQYVLFGLKNSSIIHNSALNVTTGSHIYIGGGNTNVEISYNNFDGGTSNGFSISNLYGAGINSGLTIANNSITGHNNSGKFEFKLDPTGYFGTLNASCNWWGTTDYSAIVPKINGNVNFLNFLTTSNLTGGSCTGVGPIVNETTGQSYMAIQPAIDAALAGQVIKVPAGTYTENVSTVGKPGVIISIGASPACVEIIGNVTLKPADTWVVDIKGSTACTGFDKATINGNFTAGGAKLEVKVDPDYVPALASEYEIFNVSGTIAGAFSATTYSSGRNRFNVAIAAPSIKLVTTNALAVDIALYEVGCAAFKVVLKPSVTLESNLSNVQFTLKYPASVVLTNVVSPLGLITGTPLATSGGFKYETYVVEPNAGAGWAAGTEHIVLTFNHNQLGTGTGDFVILPPADATITTSYYTEYIGSNVTGTIYANASGSWLDGCPVHNETKDLWYYKIQAAIDEAAATNVVRAFNKTRNSGIYSENLAINKALTLVGPNDAVSPNGGARVPEVEVIPGATKKDLVTVSASDVTIKGLTLNGDNPAITSGYNGTNGADLDNYDGIFVGVDNVNNLTVQNNIIKNLMYFALDLYGAYPIANNLASGLLIDNNLIKDMGYYTGVDTDYAFWGGGVLIYNNSYARITNNVMTNVRTGIQTGNFWRANSGSADYQVIENNTIQARRNAIFHNLHYGSASPMTFRNNTITALANANETTWIGIRYSSLSVNSFGINNMIDGAGVTIPSWGNVIWNVKNTNPADIKGGEVKNVDYGVYANNYEGYASNGGDGASVIVTGMTIMPKATGYGIYGLDSPSYTGAETTGFVDVKAYNNKIIGGAEAIKLAETRANKVSATFESNSITGYTQAVNSNIANTVQATCNWWGTANLSTIASKITNEKVIYSPYRSTDTEIAPKVYSYGFDPAATCETYVLPLKVWLQGPYSTASHNMTTGINAKVPTNQPFNVAPWGYPGTETLPGTISADVVDWVLVEARSNATDAVERSAGLLYKNGGVNVAFNHLAQDINYHFVVYHRNHLPVMSANLVPLSSFTAPLDLTVAANLYGNANATPNKPAINLEPETETEPAKDVWGMIAGDVTHNGTLQYSGPGNDRGPIIARINAGVVGATMNSVLTNGYWFEDVLLDNNVKYMGNPSDRQPIISNLGTLTGTTYLNAVYTTPVPLVNTGGIQLAPAFKNRPVSIEIDNNAISIATSEIIRDGMVDNIQFTLAWTTGNKLAEQAISKSTSTFMLMPQGKPVNIDGVSHQVYVSTNMTQLPKTWGSNEPVNVMTFENSVSAGTLWIADNDFTATNNAMYYVSIWGEDYTGEIKSKIPTGNNALFGSEGIRLYPNPSNTGKVYVEMNESMIDNAQVSVYDVNGKVLRNTKMATAGNVITIDVSTLVSGIYFVRVVNNNTTQNCRFIVNN